MATNKIELDESIILGGVFIDVCKLGFRIFEMEIAVETLRKYPI